MCNKYFLKLSWQNLFLPLKYIVPSLLITLCWDLPVKEKYCLRVHSSFKQMLLKQSVKILGKLPKGFHGCTKSKLMARDKVSAVVLLFFVSINILSYSSWLDSLLLYPLHLGQKFYKASPHAQLIPFFLAFGHCSQALSASWHLPTWRSAYLTFCFSSECRINHKQPLGPLQPQLTPNMQPGKLIRASWSVNALLHRE